MPIFNAEEPTNSQLMIRFFLFSILTAFAVLLQAQSVEIDLNKIKHNFQKESIPESAIAELQVTDSHFSQDNQHQYIYTQQFISGIPVHNAIGTSVLDTKTNTIVGQTNSFRSLTDTNSAKARYGVKHGIDAVITSTIGETNYTLEQLASKASSQYSKYKASEVTGEEILAKLIYYPNQVGKLMPCIEINIWLEDIDEWKQWILDANTLSIVNTQSWTVSCAFDHGNICHHQHDKSSVDYRQVGLTTGTDSSYHVLALPLESPIDGQRTIEATPWNNAPNASPYGWHDLDGITGVDTTVTFGNNVQAYEDTDDDNAPNLMPDGGANLCFDFPFDDNLAPATYLDAATVNLFYWNNMVHDVLYQYGFDEGAGNFQNINYSNTGAGGDYVNAECQDGGGTNNANFSTPPDGSNPRMQMYNWQISSSPDTFEVLSPIGVSGLYNTISASFGPTNVSILDTLVLAEDIEACSPLTNAADIAGQIAVIDRGTCTFVSKVEEAQNAGAVAVVVCNNINTEIFAMGGSNAAITIPSVMLSMDDCITLKAAMPDIVVEISTGGVQFRDSDFDNGVIIHEYGHGVSTRLTGGASNTGCLFNEEQMGEGWSDYFGLMLTMKPGDSGSDSRGIGNYLLNQDSNGGGIRPLPYSTDLAINDHTYADIASVSVPHGVGSVWCVMLWDMTWALIDQYGYDPDIYNGTGGNNMALQLVIDGLKLQACSPGFVDGRDAILLADQINNDGANQCLIWSVFAARGLGYSADQGSTGSVDDSVEGYDLPPSCQDILAIFKSGDEVITKGDTIDYTLYAFNNSGVSISNASLEDTLSTALDYVDTSLSGGSEANNIIGVSLNQFDDEMDTTVTFKAVPTNTSTTVTYFEDFELANSGWTAQNILGSDGFNLTSTNPYSGAQHWFIENVGADNTHSLESTDITLGTDPGFSMWHAYDTEAGWDGGLVEYSTDSGASWNSITDYLIVGNYEGTIGDSSNDDIANKDGWSGNSNGYINSVASLRHLSGMSVRFRLLFGSDNNTFSEGWYIDDISIYDVPCIENIACVHGTSAASFCDTISTYIITDCPTFYKLFLDADNDGFGSPSDSIYTCNITEVGYVGNSDDCDDMNDSVYLGAMELCDGIDNDCDGNIDEDSSSTWYADTDNDGYGDINITLIDCMPPLGYVSNSDDCDDSNPNINPDALELCDDIDNNCDGNVDEGIEVTWYSDTDNDGFGDPDISVFDCNQPAGYVDNALDCNDSNSDINPNATETCDNLDNNCNGLVDEVCSGSLICQDDILYINVNDELIVIADSIINSDAVIDMLDSTYFYAGDTISLGIGFEAIIGKSFNAIIEDCADN